MNPLYKYVSISKKSCDYCNEEGFEVIQSVKDKVIETCPECDSKVEKVFGRQAKKYTTERRMNYSQTNQDLRRMGLKKYKKTSKGYKREA